MTMFWDGRIKPFHTDRYEAGHRATDYKKWLNATRPYKIRCGGAQRAALLLRPAPLPPAASAGARLTRR